MAYKLPTHLITGFLGSGKTTAIQALLAQKPEHERWALIVNEFGEVGVDPMAIETRDDLQLTPLSGGCVCCRLGPQLHASLKQLLETESFDRLLIEPTGMGHPSGMLDTLRKPWFRDRLDLRAVICLLDPRQLRQEALLQNASFIDQIHMADVVVANKADLASDEDLQYFYQSLGEVYPPKQQLLVTQRGRFDIQLLDVVRDGQFQAQHPQAHHHDHAPHHAHDEVAEPVRMLPEPCRPVRYENAGLGLVSCGWIFHPEDIFSFDDLETLLQGISGVVRLKGVFRLGAAWVFINRVGTEMDYDAINYRRDSRLEILASAALDWDKIEAALIRLVEKGVDSPYRDL